MEKLITYCGLRWHIVPCMATSIWDAENDQQPALFVWAESENHDADSVVFGYDIEEIEDTESFAAMCSNGDAWEAVEFTNAEFEGGLNYEEYIESVYADYTRTY